MLDTFFVHFVPGLTANLSCSVTKNRLDIVPMLDGTVKNVL